MQDLSLRGWKGETEKASLKVELCSTSAHCKSEINAQAQGLKNEVFSSRWRHGVKGG
ncbi:UNVERIFIED_CONTAM: hypothetical protein FKN15_062199 [Acipenser sinensis]